jgi:hypothetical protein
MFISTYTSNKYSFIQDLLQQFKVYFNVRQEQIFIYWRFISAIQDLLLAIKMMNRWHETTAAADEWRLHD